MRSKIYSTEDEDDSGSKNAETKMNGSPPSISPRNDHKRNSSLILEILYQIIYMKTY